MYNYDPYRDMLKNRGVKQEQLIREGVINRGNTSSLKKDLKS